MIELLESFEGVLGELSPLALGIAALAGVLASAICPCTLPVGLGVASISGATESGTRRSGLLIAAGFFGGIAVSLAVLGAFAGRVGLLLEEEFGRYWAVAMAVLSLLAAGVAFHGLRLKPGRLAALRRPGVAGAFLYGLIFSLGTSVAPLLLVVTFAAAEARPGYGLVLGLSFGIGRGAPFLAIGLFAGLVAHLATLNRWRRGMEITAGMVLLVLAGYFTWAAMALF